MAKIINRQKNKDGTETIVFPNEENSLECIIVVGKAPRVHKIYNVPNDKKMENLQLIMEGKPVSQKYVNKPNGENK